MKLFKDTNDEIVLLQEIKGELVYKNRDNSLYQGNILQLEPYCCISVDTETLELNLIKIGEEGSTSFIVRSPNQNLKDTVGENSIDLTIHSDDQDTDGTGASGDRSFSSGNHAVASGDRSVSIGNYAKALGFGDTAIGPSSEATGGLGVAFQGGKATALGAYSSGPGSISSGNYATSIGRNCQATGEGSSAMGYDSVASGQFSTAFGNDALASGSAAIAMGIFSRALGFAATAIGRSSSSEGSDSISMGINTKAIGDSSISLGENNESISKGSLVVGTFATKGVGQNSTGISLTDEAFKVGNGSGTGSRSDAYTLYKNGVEKVTGISGADLDAMTAEDGMRAYVNATNATFTSLGFWGRENGTWVKL